MNDIIQVPASGHHIYTYRNMYKCKIKPVIVYQDVTTCCTWPVIRKQSYIIKQGLSAIFAQQTQISSFFQHDMLCMQNLYCSIVVYFKGSPERMFFLDGTGLENYS